MTQDEARRIFVESGGLRDVHARGVSGRHVLQYIDFGAVVRYSRDAALALARGLAVEVAKTGSRFHYVLAPSGDAEILAREVALSLGNGTDFVIAQKQPDGTFDYNYKPHMSRRYSALVVDDVGHTGLTFERLCDAARRGLDRPMRRAAIWVRSHKLNGVIALVNEEIPSYEPEVCPTCLAGVPISSEVGHGVKEQ